MIRAALVTLMLGVFAEGVSYGDEPVGFGHKLIDELVFVSGRAAPVIVQNSDQIEELRSGNYRLPVGSRYRQSLFISQSLSAPPIARSDGPVGLADCHRGDVDWKFVRLGGHPPNVHACYPPRALSIILKSVKERDAQFKQLCAQTSNLKFHNDKLRPVCIQQAVFRDFRAFLRGSGGSEGETNGSQQASYAEPASPKLPLSYLHRLRSSIGRTPLLTQVGIFFGAGIMTYGIICLGVAVMVLPPLGLTRRIGPVLLAFGSLSWLAWSCLLLWP
jgi:hypothetical protein